MKIDLMVMSGTSADLLGVYGTLRRSGIRLLHVENIYDAKAGLATHSPAFILLDFDIKGANSLLNEFAFGQYIPQPYIMVAATYSDGNDRADMFKRGADYCIDKPINAHEVSAIIDAVLRRDKRMCTIEYKEMCYDYAVKKEMLSRCFPGGHLLFISRILTETEGALVCQRLNEVRFLQSTLM